MKSNLKVARLFALFFTLLFSLVMNAQPLTKVFKNETLKNVLKEIENQTGLSVIYRNSDLNENKRITASFNDVPLSEVMNTILDGNLEYSVESNILVISKKGEKPTLVQHVQQGRTIRGRIVDAQGEPIIGASIAVVGTGKGTVTDSDGNYTLNDVSDSDVIAISYIGYKTQEFPANSTSLGRIVLQEDNEMLDEVVVIGYGANARKQDLSASVGVISNTDKLVVRPVTSTESMLQGQLAGVTVQSNGGDPTSTPNIVIRGQGSQNGDNVLWVVDGVPGAPIASINDIESIVVLKDAASAAIYGAQSGAGGVVLVTTKKAKAGEPSLIYEGTFGIRQASKLPTPLNAEQQLKMRKLSHTNAGMSLPDGWDVNKNPWVGTTRTNWIDEIFRSGFYQRNHIALNGGTENFTNRLSFAYDNDQGVLINTYNKNLSLRYNGKFDLNKWISISEDFVWKNGENHTVGTNEGYTGGILSAIYMPASATVYNPLDQTYGGTTTEDPAYIAEYGSNFAEAHGDAVNPVRLLKANNLFNRSSDIWTTTTLQLSNLLPGVKFVSRFTYNLYNDIYKNFSPMRDEPGKPDLSNSLDYNTFRSSSWKTENTLTYDNTFGKHTLGALLSTTADYYNERGINTNGKTFADESTTLQYLKYAGTTTAQDYMIGPDANVSVVSRLAYSYNDRYFATASWRRDYAGRLPKENNYGDFPAVTLAWKISNENFFPKSDAINLMKLRGSWGRVGNLGSIGYNYKSLLLGTKYWAEQSIYGVSNNSMYKNFVYNSKALNPKLTWETSEQIDLGLDFVMFSNNLTWSVDYFDKRTFNLIQSQTINWPNTIGLDPMLINQGEIRNRGVELDIAWRKQVNKDFSYFISGNYTYLKNWVSNIGVTDGEGNPGVWTEENVKFRNLPYVIQTAQGQPLGSFYLIKTDGIFQSDAEAAAYVKDGKRIQPNAVAGDLKFVDFNNDGEINDKDRQYLGSATPHSTYAFTTGAAYKKISLSAMFQGVQGAKAFYGAKFMTLSDVEGNFNRDSKILDAWSPSNTSSKIPRLSKNDPNSNFSNPSDWYLEDASYLRLKNITLSYDMTDWVRKIDHLKDRNSSLSMYLSGENLFTLTKYSGMDPEVGGWDAMKYPVSRVFSLGIKLTY
ncbi:MAG: SusC/RagA family TonB-linked outer membrane protein [Proteiniphilum sp.]|nr:SusC/RagA family TonB-linked outer membrane protein [Proteiniphilum sp.]MDD3908379.1 SusC/RagA family TonB-linked outer membrane protein [Proteiniphilum sp.]MDD4415782.1 SusC/RagA family TonB-linked outer membrane protein [Proteiniphilum sp.]